MQKEVSILLDKMGIDYTNSSFFDSLKLEKVVVEEKSGEWDIYLNNEALLDVEAYKELEENKDKLGKANIYYDITSIDNNILLSYYKTLLELAKEKNELSILEPYLSNLILEDDNLLLVASNTIEERRLIKIKDIITPYYKRLGYSKDIDIVVRENESIKEEIEEELAKIKVEPIKVEEVKEEKKEFKNFTPGPRPRRSKKRDEGCILGLDIKQMPIKISMIQGEDNNVIVEGNIFGVDYFESSKSEFRIITLKITDNTDSILCKVFCNEQEEYERLCKELKVGRDLLISGYVKEDAFAKELVLNARDIMPVTKHKEEIQDLSERKRVELHAHTKMSQMDGVVDEIALVKQAIKWGHKGIAITDHNGAQAFPHVYNFVRDYNKGKEENEKFKAIYGTELVMVDDKVDIVVRPNNDVLLDDIYVVFDFETTGFNAGGADSIIEIGAVKMKDGVILEKYDELINPGRPLPQKIVDVTNITDMMLEGKRSEEEAIKDFINWFGDLPMVAHNAKFDVSFLEMAYEKYNLGEFKNPVIDTLELSRTLDNNYARHSLSALVKRYNVPWDENAHHRGDYDAEGTALVFYKMLEKLNNRNIETMQQMATMVDESEMYKYGTLNHINILTITKKGLKNLFKIISYANTTYLYKTPRIPRSIVEQYREDLLIGSGCYESEVFRQAKSKSEEELSNVIRFYDYVEVQPPECYHHLIDTSDFGNEVELNAHIEKIIRTTIEAGKLIVATGDVHHLTREDKIYREIIVNQKVPGGGRHPLAKSSIKEIPSNHFRTTDEMLNDFSFLDEKTRNLIVIDNPNKILDMVEEIEVIIETGGIPFSPRIDKSVETVTDLVFTRASDWYGDPLPYNIEERISKELYGDGIFEAITAEVNRENIKEEDKAIYVTGHSKGGNLALVSAMELDDFLLKKIVAVDNFDGPGLRLEEYNSLKYKKVLKKLNNIVPSMSCVGILLNNSNYQVVASNLFAFEQHYPTSWNIFGQVFVPNELAKSSIQLHESTTAGVENLNQEKIEYAFETLFTNLGKEYTKPVKVTMEDIKNILKNMKNIDREVYSYIETILSAMISVSYKDSDLEVL